MADKNVFDDPTFGAPKNAFDDPNLGKPSGVARRVIGDTAVGLAQGAVALPQAALGIADAVTGGAVDRVGGVIRSVADKAVNAVGDAVTGGHVGRDFGTTGDTASQGMQATADRIGQYYSPEAKAALAAAHDKAGEYGKAGEAAAGTPGRIAGEFAGAVIGTAQNPGAILPVIAQSAPSMLAPMAITGKVAGVIGERAMLAAKAAGAAPEAAVAAGRAAVEKFVESKAGIATAAASEGVVGGGQNAAQAKTDVLGMPEDKLAQLQPYRDLLAAGVSPQDARLQLAESAERRTALVSGALSTLAGPIAGKFEAKAGARLAGGELAAGVGQGAGFKAGLRNAAAEATQETFQSAGEQVGQNVGMRAADPNADLWDQVGEQAGQGAIAGAVMGGGVHALTRERVIGKADEKPAESPVISGALPAPGETTLPMNEGGRATPEQVAAAEAADTNAGAIYAARAAEEARQAELRRQNPLQAAAGLLPAPGQTSVAGAIDSEAGVDPLTATHRANNAQENADAVYAARDAHEAEMAKLRTSGVLGAAAATAIDTGSHDQAQQKRQGEIQQALTPETAHAIPEAVSEAEKANSAGIAEQLSRAKPMTLEEAQSRVTSAFGRQSIMVVPLEGGGYTTMAATKLSARQQRAVKGLQSPAAEVQAEPAQKQLPLATVEAAKTVAQRRTMETGVEHTVVPHPLANGKFAVAPAPRAEAAPVQPQGVSNGTKEAPAAQRASQDVAGNPADAAGAPAPAAGQAAAEAPQAQGVTPPATDTAKGPAAAPPEASPAPEAQASPAYAEISRLAAEAATSPENDRPHPTAGQTAAGNYKKVRVPPALVHGLPITLENPAGSVRVAQDGSWASHTPNHYGYIRQTEGNDGDKVDVTIGPRPESTLAFVVDQKNPGTGAFDEHKVMLGFDSAETAEAAYRAAYPADWKGMGAITPTTVDELKSWLKTGDTKAEFAARAGGKNVDFAPTTGGFQSATLDFSARPVTTDDPASMPEMAHLFGRPAQRIMDIEDGQQADSQEAGAIAAIVKELRRLGMPDAAFDGLRPIFIMEGSHKGVYFYEDASIGLSHADLRLAARGDKWAAITQVGKLAHEITHHVTGDANGTSFAAQSPDFYISTNDNGSRIPRGGVIKEVFDKWRTGKTELRAFFNYPLAAWSAKPNNAEHTIVLQDEVMAQLGRLYYTNPRLLRLEMPKAFALMEEIHNAVSAAGSIADARRGVQRALQSAGAASSARVDAGARADQNAAGRAGLGQPGAGVGGRAVRESAAVDPAGQRSGLGDARLAAAPQAGQAEGQARRLTGAPQGYEPSARAQSAARDYMKAAGLPYNPPTDYVRVDPERSARIAQAYANMKHEPQSMPVKAAYSAMIRETLAQWKAIEKTGLKVTFADAEHPYPYKVPGEVFHDVNVNNHMWVFPTNDGFGSDATFDAADNPLLADTGITIKGHKLVANDVFRIVHDYFGHIKDGVGFRANGEENAWRAHAAMFTPLARRAMTSETRGQNSWLNFGPHGETNRTAKTEDTVFADQKTGLMPEWVSEDNYAKRPGKLEVKEATVGAERGERATGRKALSAADQMKIAGEGAKLGMTPAEIKALQDQARVDMSRFPPKDGWAPLEIVGAERKPKTLKDGSVVYENAVKYKALPYGFNAPPGAARAPIKVDQAWAAKVADQGTKAIVQLYADAKAGNEVARNIVAHASWYRAMASRLRAEFGAAGDLFADLLGATSPNTPVETNWRFAVDVIKQFSRGEFNLEMMHLERWIADGKPISSFPPDAKIRQLSGKLYGMNSGNAMVALLNLWRNIEPGTAPKARNFALNLIGQSDMATIDVWAARFLRRMADGVRGATYARIPTPAEKGVTGKWNANATGVGGEFGFGAAVMQQMSDALKAKGIDLTPPDLQAVAWFVEKALWTEKNWTSKQGEGGSFETEADKAALARFLAGWSIQTKDAPSNRDVELEASRLLATLAGDDQVIAARAVPTIGMYDAQSQERSFDIELTVGPKWSPWAFVGELTRIAQERGQDSFFFSRVLGPNEESGNSRPGVEIYFKTERDFARVLPLIQKMTAGGQQGFTLTVDPRSQASGGATAEKFNGVRIQYIPEFEIRFGGPNAEALTSGKADEVARIIAEREQALNKLAGSVMQEEGVALAMLFNYDTLVVTKEEYDAYSDAAAGDRAESSREGLRAGQPLHQVLADAARRYESGGREERGNDVPFGPADGEPDGVKRPSSLAVDTSVTETPAFKKWFGDSKVVDDSGKPMVVYHGTFNDFSEFDTDEGTTEGAAFFSVNPDVASAFADPIEWGQDPEDLQPNVRPVYLSVKNPMVAGPEDVMVDGSHSFDAMKSTIRRAKRLSHDGILIKGVEDGVNGVRADQWAVFEPTQIKSAIGNNGNFDAKRPSILEVDTSIAGDSGRAYTPEQQAFFKAAGREVETPTLKERISLLWKDAGKKMAQGLVDQFAPIKDLSTQAYTLARLSKGAAGAFEALLKFGKLSLRDNVYDADTSGGVIDKVFAPLHGEGEDFLWWIAANRADRLTGEDREHLFSGTDIAAGKSLATGQTTYDWTIQNGPRAGQTTRDRAEIYNDAHKSFDAFNRNVMNMAEQSGLIDGASRRFWEHEFYVPFYRQSEDGVRGVNVKSGLVRQQAFKSLKGGSDKLNSDLLANTLQNWAHLLDASAKNRAAKATLEAAVNVGVAVEAPQATIQQMGNSLGMRKNTAWFLDGGKQRFFLIEDQHVLAAINGLEFAGLRGPLMDAMSTFKHWLTMGVTASPFFKVRNLIRDSVQAISSSGLSYNVVGNIKEGFAASNHDNPMYASMLASGAVIHFGTMLESREADRVRQLAKQGVSSSTILQNEAAWKRVYDKFIEPGISAYNELGNRSEEINRAALYKQLTDQGMDHATAALMARDLLDFSMQGAWTSVRFLTQVVPFLNARLQGLYKLGRAAKDDPKKLTVTLGAVALASIALLLAYHDDDDWKKREDWDRDNFWWFKIGGVAYRIPKPFEIGAIASVAERGLELVISDEMNGKRFADRMMALLSDNLSMNPVPQLVKPVLDVYSNKDSFTGRPIENMGMDRLLPQQRFTQNTSMGARAISTAGNAVTGVVGKQFLSPVQIDSMIRGYFGWLGTFVVAGTDMVLRPVTDQPTRPAADMVRFATGGLATELPDQGSRYVSDMYAQATSLEQAYATWRDMQKQRNPEQAKAFLEQHREEIAKYGIVERVKKAESALNMRIKLIQGDRSLSADEKREKIQQLNDQRSRSAQLLAAGLRNRSVQAQL